MPNLVNRLVVKELTADFSKAEGLIVVAYGAMKAKENEALRNKLASKGCDLKLVRNSLARLVLSERGYEVGDDVLTGNTAIAFGNVDAVLHAARVLTSPEVKKAAKVKIRAAVLEGRLLGAADALALADVPDRNTLNAKILGCLSGPSRGLVSLLNAVPNGLVRLLKARADQLAANAPPGAAEPVNAPSGAAETANAPADAALGGGKAPTGASEPEAPRAAEAPPA